ncbi:MAG TPA: potassium transporter TrkG, partial [Erysipelotrichaceae bacterium]|nr:potassium transporter TrkG [Erysipelotrichaceae bacterium]
LNEAVNFFNLNDFHHFIINILKYTIIFESIGFLLYAIRFVPQFGWSSGIFISLFTAVSAFVNAGLDIIGPVSLQAYAHDPIVNFTTMYLIVVGGLGFGVWFDLSQGSKSLIRKSHPLQYVVKHLKVHTKIVITTTLALIFGGALLILLIEFNNPNTIQSFNFFDKIMASLFQSITTRTAGFATLNMASMKAASLLIMMLLMFIGGSPGGTAGGIKTTTFAILVLMIVSELRNKKEIIVFNRKIEREQFRKAFVIAFILLMTVTTGIILLLIIEPFDLLSIAFESISAIATVGLSMGITSSLSYIGKVIIISLMYLGRIGPLTLMLSIGRKQSSKKGQDISYPSADILIG